MSALHHLNTDFVWQDRPSNRLRRLARQQVEQFNRLGFCILKKAISADQTKALLMEIDPLECAGGGSVLVDPQGNKLAKFQGDELTFTCNLTKRSKLLAGFYRSNLFAEITDDLIGGKCRLYWDQAVYKHPQKGGEFPWHQDNGYTFVRPQNYLTCWLALSDAPIEAGCPWVIPGAHKEGTYGHVKKTYGLEIENVENLVEDYGEIAAPVAAGDMVIFSSLTPHKTGANLCRHVRKALIVQFIPDGAVRIDPTTEVMLDDASLHPLL